MKLDTVLAQAGQIDISLAEGIQMGLLVIIILVLGRIASHLGKKAMNLVGEALVGEGNEVAHIDLQIGHKWGPVGIAFAYALATARRWHTNLLAVLEPNLPVVPFTVMIPKVTMEKTAQVMQMFGTAQKAVADAVSDCVAAGIIPELEAHSLRIVVAVFIHKEATNDQKIYDFNYEATKQAIENAMRGKQTVRGMLRGRKEAKHPFNKATSA